MEEAGFFDCIMYKGASNRPLGWAEKIVNLAIVKVRGAVERAFGIMKKHYGLGRARYPGDSQGGDAIPALGHGLQPKEGGPIGRGIG
ncbi:MAG: hypothetical protein V1797_04300 [Pseudomonadota bacterium]